MRVSKEQFRQNGEKILQAAGRLFRERGFEAVGVADVMKAAGLTHGGFYGHFKSKDDLFAQATGAAGLPFIDLWERIVEEEGPKALEVIAERYLGDAHCRAVGAGCQIAALGPEIARRTPEDRAAATAAIKRLTQVLEKAAPGDTPAERRKTALRAYAGWIGAVVLARVSDDEALSKEVRAAVAEGPLGLASTYPLGTCSDIRISSPLMSVYWVRSAFRHDDEVALGHGAALAAVYARAAEVGQVLAFLVLQLAAGGERSGPLDHVEHLRLLLVHRRRPGGRAVFEAGAIGGQRQDRPG